MKESERLFGQRGRNQSESSRGASAEENLVLSPQTGPVQDPAGLPGPVGGVWGAGVRLSVSFHLHRHALLSGGGQRRSLPHALHQP